MLKQIKQSLKIILNQAYIDNPWSHVYGLARAFLSLSLLVTLIFTGYKSLFPTNDGFPLRQPVIDFEKISIFYMMNDNLSLAWLISIIILLVTISGYIPQITCFFHWWVSYSYITSSIIIEGGDQIAAILSLLLIPVCITDNRANHWYLQKACNRRRTKMFIWSIYAIIILQISIIYFHAGIAKLFSNEWLNGTATYYWFTHNMFGVSENIKNILTPLLAETFIVVFITWGTIILELILFGWLFMKRNYWNWKLLFLFGVFFHLSIAFIHGLISFMFTMIGALILYLFPKNIDLNLRLKIWKQ